MHQRQVVLDCLGLLWVKSVTSIHMLHLYIISYESNIRIQYLLSEIVQDSNNQALFASMPIELVHLSADIG